MRRRRAGPVVQTKANDTADLRAERARKLENVRKLEWEFDRHPSFDLVHEIRSRRVELSDLEDQITLVIEEGAARALMGRVDALQANELLERANNLDPS